MDIFTYALQFEKDGEHFYREAAEKLTDPNLKHILTFLAQEEQNHFELIKKLRDGTRERPKSIFISDIRNIFTQMNADNIRFHDDRSTVVDILEKALVAEQDSINYYRTKLEEVDAEDAKNLLGLLKRQEETHYSLISSLIEYYERPDLWLENAEFNHLEEY